MGPKPGKPKSNDLFRQWLDELHHLVKVSDLKPKVTGFAPGRAPAPAANQSSSQALQTARA